MHIHILGICGTFMGGVAALARAAGHSVTGSDANVYPPMSAQLAALGIAVTEGYSADALQPQPDCVLIGNALSRANPAVEAVLDRGLLYMSGPEWLARYVLCDRHVLAVAGTHGKTTTSSMLAWILEDAGRSPGFLIGGVPANFGITARYGDSPFFVVEADEYDTAFFDKRAKFVHYRPRTLVLNNIEFDHADIYTDLEAILWQFHQLIRTVPGNGRILLNAGDRNLRRLLEMGCWTETENFGLDDCADWRASFSDAAGLAFCASNGADRAETGWQLSGDYNLENAIAAIAAAHSAGVPLDRAVDAMSRFSGVKRRLERTDEVAGIFVYDDFAHHPTAIRRTIEGMKARYPGERLFIALELRSNTMKLGVHNDTLAAALSGADHVAIYRPDDAGIALDASVAELGDRLSVYGKYGDMLSGLRGRLLPGDHLVFMSNGGFGAVRERLTAALKAAL